MSAADPAELEPPTAAVCVYCGSRSGNDPRHTDTARRLGVALAAEKIRLIYGAGDLGLMGAVSKACISAGGDATGFIPRGLWEREIASRPLPDVVVTENLHQRKALMLQNAQGVAVLPGGVGTLDELIEALTWRQIQVHRKPIVLIEADGYWTPLLTLFEHMERQGFLHPGFFDTFETAATPEACARRLRELMA